MPPSDEQQYVITLISSGDFFDGKSIVILSQLDRACFMNTCISMNRHCPNLGPCRLPSPHIIHGHAEENDHQAGQRILLLVDEQADANEGCSNNVECW